MVGKLKADNAKARAAADKSSEQPRLSGTEAKSEMMGDMPKSKFEKLLDGIDNAEQRKDDGAMSMASAAKAFKDAGGNYDALKLVRKLEGMSPEKRKDFIRHFDTYGEYFEIRADTADLFKDDKATKDQAVKPLDALKNKEETKEDQGAYEAGIAACKFDKPRASNPHPKDSSMYDAFDRGWIKARELRQKGTLKQGGEDQARSSDTVVTMTPSKKIDVKSPANLPGDKG